MEFQKHAAGYIFRCTNRTQDECLKRMLFGETATEGHQHMTTEVKKGSCLFLYNLDSGQLFGMFKAAEDGRRDIEKDAWGGKFPWQVKVEWDHKFEQPLPKEIASKVIHFWGLTHRHPREVLTANQVSALLELFKSRQNLPPYEADFRKKFPAEFRAEDGHWVRSFAELLIDNWLFSQRLVHGYERKIPIAETMFCDFFLPTIDKKRYVYIEYWGMEDDRYLERKKRKIETYKKYGLPLIELVHPDLNHLDDVLPVKLRPYFPETTFF